MEELNDLEYLDILAWLDVYEACHDGYGCTEDDYDVDYDVAYDVDYDMEYDY